jgi:hypothetical protein
MIYVAMFDEVDEGTAIYKVAENSSQTPTTGQFVTLDIDGENLPSDWYLRLTAEATKMLRNQIALTATIPIDPNATGSQNNYPPQAVAGSDQAVLEGDVVTLNGSASTDPDGSIVSFFWEQLEGTAVSLSNSNSSIPTFTAPAAGTSGDRLTFRLTVTDDGGLTAVGACVVDIFPLVVSDSDGDGVPDDQDDFPHDADEYEDTDKDGEGNNADTDDDNDGMPDDWELTYGLNPLADDADQDLDEDGVSNIDEFNSGTDPGNSAGGSLNEQVDNEVASGDVGCFIITASAGSNDYVPKELWHASRGRELWLIYFTSCWVGLQKLFWPLHSEKERFHRHVKRR